MRHLHDFATPLLRRPALRRSLPAILAAALALVLTGCGAKSSMTETGSSTTDSGSTSGTAPKAAVLTFSVAPGTYPSTQTVTITSDTPGVTIYYTTDGSAPTTSSAVYTAPITVSVTETVQAIAVTPASGSAPPVTSSTYSAGYTITSPAAAPTFSIASGTYASAQTVTLSTTTPGATIYYTTDGSTPTLSSTVYTSPITVSSSETLKAIAIAPNYATSPPASAAYTINLQAAAPTFSNRAGTYTFPQHSAMSISLSTITPGAAIYYTTDGSNPTTSSTPYTTNGIQVSSSETIQAIAVAPGYLASPVAVATYTINYYTTAPVISLPTNTYTSPQTVAITDSQPGAVIYYTTDGSNPTTSSTPYTGPITVSNGLEFIGAIAVAPNFQPSFETSVLITIHLPPVIHIGGPYTGTAGIARTFSASATSGAPGYNIASYSWDFGDGSTESELSSLPVTHTYTNPGTYTLTLTVTDDAHVSATTTTTVVIAAPLSGPAITGTIEAGARVYLLAVGTSGYGAASVSVLNAANTNDSDSIGPYVTADDGTFSFTGLFTCTSSQQLYIYAVGSTPTSTLLAVLGSCPTSPMQVKVNEATTIAAAYALAGFATDPLHISSSGTPLALTGVANAFANAQSLVSLSTGQALTTTPAGNGTVPQAEINTLANVIEPCVELGAITPVYCTQVFAATTPPGGTAPTDTTSAALSIAHNPINQVATIYALGTQGPLIPYSPVLTTQPNDFTLGVSYNTNDPYIQYALAIDAQGNAWIADGGSQLGKTTSALIKLAPNGAILSGTNGFMGGGLFIPAGLTIDLTGNVWAINYEGNKLSEFDNSGNPLSGSSGIDIGLSPTGASAFNLGNDPIDVDASGNVWVGTLRNSIVETDSSGNVLQTISTPYPVAGISIDENQHIWTAQYDSANHTGGGFYEYATDGTLLSSIPLTTPDYAGPIATDSAGNVWDLGSIAGPVPYGYQVVLNKMTATGTPLVSSSQLAFSGLDSLAIDGAGVVWTGGSIPGLTSLPAGGYISETANDGTPVSESPYGFSVPSGDAPSSLAVDGSGDVWSTIGRGNVYEMIGAATPVVTPTSAAVASGALGTRP